MTIPTFEIAPHVVRVSISIPGLNIDVPLPSNIPVDLVLSDLIPFLRQTLVQQQLSTAWIDQLVQWKLTTKFGQRLAPTKTLDDQGILHGDIILIEVEKTAEQFTPLIDDIADAVATIQARTYPNYIPRHSTTIISYALIIFSATLALLMGYFGQFHREGIAQWTPETLLISGATILITAWVLDKKNNQSEETTYPTMVIVSLILTGFFWILAGMLIIIPRPLGAAQVLAAAATMLALAVVSSRITLGHPLLHGTIIVPSLIFTFIGALQVAFPQPIGTLGAEIVLCAILAVFSTTKVSLALAHISLPPTPAPGEEHVKDNVIIAVGELISSTDTKHDGVLPTIAAEEENRAIRQFVVSNSILLGAVITATIGSYIAADITAPRFWYILGFLAVTSGIFLFRGKSYSDLINRSILYIGALTVIFVAWIHLLLHENQTTHIIYFTLPVVIVFFAFFVGVINGKTLDAPISRQRVEILERILYASVFPLITMISGLYSKARYHS